MQLQAPFSLGSPTGTGIRPGAAPSAPIGSLGGPRIRAAVGLRLPPGDSPGSTRGAGRLEPDSELGGAHGIFGGSPELSHDGARNGRRAAASTMAAAAKCRPAVVR